MFRARLAIALVIICVALVLAGISAKQISAQRAQRPPQLTAKATVQKYFRILNAGMQSGNFSAMKSVYQSNGVLTQSNPLGETKISRGLAQITAFYTAAYVKFKGLHWTQDTTHLLSKNVVLNYEFASRPSTIVPGRCAHLFRIKNGRIVSLNWITFYSGQ